jgi:hypothetical protein
MFINDPPVIVSSFSEPVIYADDTSVIISNINFGDYSTMSNLVLSHMIQWFGVNMFFLNLGKTNIIKYIVNTSPHCASSSVYKEKYTEEMVNTKFLGCNLITTSSGRIILIK